MSSTKEFFDLVSKDANVKINLSHGGKRIRRRREESY